MLVSCSVTASNVERLLMVHSAIVVLSVRCCFLNFDELPDQLKDKTVWSLHAAVHKAEHD